MMAVTLYVRPFRYFMPSCSWELWASAEAVVDVLADASFALVSATSFSNVIVSPTPAPRLLAVAACNAISLAFAGSSPSLTSGASMLEPRVCTFTVSFWPSTTTVWYDWRAPSIWETPSTAESLARSPSVRP